MTKPKIRVFLVDDHEVVIRVLSALLHNHPRIEISGAARNGRDLLDQLGVLETQHPDRLPIDVVMTDVRMPEMDGITTARRLKQRYPYLKVLLLTLCEEMYYLEQVKMVGADGYISKNKGKKEFVEGIERAYNGEFVLFTDLKIAEAGPGPSAPL